MRNWISISFLVLAFCFSYTVEAQLGWVGGRVFHDINGNCIMDFGERGLSQRLVKITQSNGLNPEYCFTDSSGFYSFKIPIRSLHQISIPKDTTEYRNYFTANRCANYASFLVASDSFPKFFYNIPQSTYPNRNDLKVTIDAPYGWEALNSSTDRYSISLKNLGSVELDSFTVKFEMPVGVVFLSSIPVPTRKMGQTLYWDINKEMELRENRKILVDVRIPSSLNPGQLIGFNAEALGSNDFFPDDNQHKLVQTVTNNIAPTFKSVYPTYLTPNTNRIQYFIHFQNKTGFLVNGVSIIDTLDTNLPLTDIRLGSSSHPYTFSVNGNVLRWDFSNINLADSTNNPNSSQGYIYFTAGVRSGLALGDSIQNTAYVIFDGLTPNATNAVVVKMAGTPIKEIQKEQQSFQLIQNGNEFDLTSFQCQLKNWIIYDLQGNLIQRFRTNPLGNYHFTLPERNSMYILRSLEGNEVKKIKTNL